MALHSAKLYIQHERLFHPATRRVDTPAHDIDRVYPISESRFIASGVFEDCRFLILDNDGNVISKCGDFPNYQSGEENIPNTAKGMFHQSQFGYNTDRKRLACATNNVLELWDYKPETLTLHKRLLLAPYHYQFNSSPDGVYAESDNPDAELGHEALPFPITMFMYCITQTPIGCTKNKKKL